MDHHSLASIAQKEKGRHEVIANVKCTFRLDLGRFVLVFIAVIRSALALFLVLALVLPPRRISLPNETIFPTFSSLINTRFYQSFLGINFLIVVVK
jgi:hypothetical protein